MSRTLLKVLSVLKCLRLSANLHTGGSAVDSNGERTLIRLLAYPGLSLTGFLRRLGWSQCWDAHNKSVCSAQLTCVRPVDVLGESALTSLIRLGQIWRRKMRRAGVREPNTPRQNGQRNHEIKQQCLSQSLHKWPDTITVCRFCPWRIAIMEIRCCYVVARVLLCVAKAF